MTTIEKIATLKNSWEALRLEQPQLRIRDAAKELGCSEAELLATGIGETVTRLSNDFREILLSVEALGKVMALTRNAYCVHERKGVYSNLSFGGPMGLAVNPDIDLRLFMNQWAFAFAQKESGRRSLQFFAKDGEAVHKIYMLEESDLEKYEALVLQFKAADQSPLLAIDPAKPVIVEKADAEVDVNGLRENWLQLKDTHDFHGMLRKFGITRIQGMRLAPAGHAVRITTASLKKMLHQAAASGLHIMVFTGSAGCIQIHTGTVKHLLQTGPWFNILDPDFNMHLRDDAIDSVWLVKKPTRDGLITSVEAFDRDGGVIVQFFGRRKPGIPENEDWRLMVNETADIAE